MIATDAAEQAELPDGCVPKVPLGDGEVAAVAALFVELASNSELHAQYEAAARSYVETECAWEVVAASYARKLAGFPAPRPSEGQVAAMRRELEAFFSRERT